MYWGYDFEICVCSLHPTTYSGITTICSNVYALGRNAGRLIYRLQTSLGTPTTLISDYMHFARWYYNHKPHREWDEHDYTRHKRFITYQSHTKAQTEHKRQEHLKKLPPATKEPMIPEHEEN